jgi:uncharacterized membrane protein YhhN
MIAGLAKDSRSRLKIPLSLYAFGLTLFLFSGLGTLANEAWPPTPALLAVAGCLLFYLSDIILARNRFVRPLQNARLKNRAGYHLGQIALIAAFLSGPVA